ncbi:MAG: histidine kinase [Spirosomataceae bacterium]
MPTPSFRSIATIPPSDLKLRRITFAIHFGILQPPQVNAYQFDYQLEGYDKNWILEKEGNQRAVYGQLDGGDYVFKVRATNTHGQSLPIQLLHIHIETPFYKTTWFRGLLAFSALLILVLFLRYRANQRLQIHQLQLQSTRLAKDKAEIQYQNLINHLNPHFLFNSLASLNSLIVADPKQASKFLQKLSVIYRYILQSKEKETVTLEHELHFIKNFVELQKARFPKGLEIHIEVEEAFLEKEIVPVTLQNLFENVIKHNIIDNENPLIINVFVEDNYLVVKNNLQRKSYVETSNKQGLDSLKKLYSYLTTQPFVTLETDHEFIVKVPLI